MIPYSCDTQGRCDANLLSDGQCANVSKVLKAHLLEPLVIELQNSTEYIILVTYGYPTYVKIMYSGGIFQLSDEEPQIFPHLGPFDEDIFS